MAAIIDGSTYPKYWKLTADDSSPNVYYVVPKESVGFKTSGATSGAIYKLHDPNEAGLVTTDANTIDEFGNALATSAAVAEYLNANK